MNYKFLILGILFLLPIITVMITDPLEIENEIDLDEIALIDSITINYMLIICSVLGMLLIAFAFDDKLFLNCVEDVA